MFRFSIEIIMKPEKKYLCRQYPQCGAWTKRKRGPLVQLPLL